MGEGLRALKKHETRLSISQAATQLFIERGFEEATIADVAAAARVAKMTVTNHFPRKEDLVFDIREKFTAWPATAIRTDPFADVRHAYFAALDGCHAYIGFSGQDFAGMVRASPALTVALREMHREREQNLAEVLLSREPDDGIRSRAMAAHLAAILRLLFDDVFEATADGMAEDVIAAHARVAAASAWQQLGEGLDRSR